MRILTASILAFATSLAVVPTAQAGSITCPSIGTAGVTRNFTLTTPDPLTATCGPYGSTPPNLSGEIGDPVTIAPYNWIPIDKDQNPDAVYVNDAWFSITGLGETSGTFTISPDAWAAGTGYGSLLIGFKVGSGNAFPDWATFILAAGTLGGSWSVNQQQGLSHANLYGQGPGIDERCIGCVSTPEPATLVLFGTGLAALAVGLRRRRA